MTYVSRPSPDALGSTLAAGSTEAGRSLGAAFDSATSAVVFRRIEAVEEDTVVLDLGLSTLVLPRDLLPEVEPGQWLRFTRDGSRIRAEVDLAATLEAEARLAKLYAMLLFPEPGPSPS